MIQAFGPLKLVPYDRGIVEVVLNNVVRGNPIDQTFCEAIEAVSIHLADLAELRAVLFRAEGPSFSVGGDLKLLGAAADTAPALALRMTRMLNSAILRLQALDAPLIAAVHGSCAGGMVGFVAGCDVVVAADSARFVSAYTGIGYSCDAGASVMLTRRMGLPRARRYLLLNERLDAASAHAAGLVDFVVCVNDFLAQSKAITERIAAGPTRAFGEIRRLLTLAFSLSLDQQLESEAIALSRNAATRDAREGVAAFLGGRQPSFQGN